jgi:hypothetical protein
MDMKNKELEDWQLGNQSVTKPLDRIKFMDEWLKKNKLEVLTRSVTEEKVLTPIGFDKLPMYE